MLGHVKQFFYMSVEQFAQAIECAKTFASDSGPDLGATPARTKVIGMIGGEPLLHPHFECLAEIMQKAIPNKFQRGLWTGIDWRKSRYSSIIQDVFGYINENHHKDPRPSLHSPVLVAIRDVVADEDQRNRLIDDCWLQKTWSSAITPKGMFFCEVAAAMDTVFNGPGGLPVAANCWARPLADFQEQIDRWCPQCGIPLQLRGRLDHEEIDDVSTSNLKELMAIGSPRVESGQFAVYDPSNPQEQRSCPWRYKQ